MHRKEENRLLNILEILNFKILQVVKKHILTLMAPPTENHFSIQGASHLNHVWCRPREPTCRHAHNELWQRWWENELCSCWHHEWRREHREWKAAWLWRVSFPPEAKPFPRQQLARRVGPYLRRASRGEALIGDWGGWRLSGWWASLIAILLEGRGLASTKLHVWHKHTSLAMRPKHIQAGPKVWQWRICHVLQMLQLQFTVAFLLLL